MIGCLREENLVPREPSLSLWYGSDNVIVWWFASNQEYWAKDIDIEVSLRRCAGQHRMFIVDWNIAEVFVIPNQQNDEVFVAILLWCA